VSHCWLGQAGDRYILVEYGNDTIDLNIRARVQLLQQRLESSVACKRALVELVANVLSLLVHYDPDEISQSALLAALVEIEHALPNASQQTIPSRLVHLPIAIDDRWSRAAIEQYAQGIRADAPYVPSNIAFIARANGIALSSSSAVTEFAAKLISSPMLVTGVGFYVGTPFAIPLDPRVRMVVPKVLLLVRVCARALSLEVLTVLCLAPHSAGDSTTRQGPSHLKALWDSEARSWPYIQLLLREVISSSDVRSWFGIHSLTRYANGTRKSVLGKLLRARISYWM